MIPTSTSRCAHYKDQKEKIGERGRNPETVKMLPMAYTVVGESTAHAEEREQLFLNDLVDPMASLTLLSELMNYDFSGLRPRLAHHRRADRVGLGICGRRRTSRRAWWATPLTLADGGLPSHLAQGPRVVGTGPTFRDQMEAWFDSGACDGFRLSRPTHTPGRTRTWFGWSCPSCSAAGCFVASTAGRHCASTSDSSVAAAASRA